MAFGNKKLMENKTEENLNTTEPEEGSNNLDFLNPKKNARKDSLNDPYQEEMLKKTAYQITLKTLNALKIVSPIITALMVNPGVDGKNEEMSSSFRLLIKEISNISGVVCEKLGVDPGKEKNYWVRNVLEKSFAEIIKEQWLKHEKIDTEKIINLINEVIEFSEKVAEKNEFDELSDITLLKLSTIKSMLPIINEAKTNFDLYRDLENDLEYIATKLYEKSSYAVTKIADDYAEQKEKAKLFYILMQEAGNIYATSWKVEGQRIQKIMESYSPDKLNKSLERYKKSGGLPLDKIDHEFDKYFDKLIIITDKLVNSQKSGLDKKLKNK